MSIRHITNYISLIPAVTHNTLYSGRRDGTDLVENVTGTGNPVRAGVSGETEKRLPRT